MTKFVIEITDPAKLAGIKAAREASDADVKTDAEYVQFVMESAAESYAMQYGVEAP